MRNFPPMFDDSQSSNEFIKRYEEMLQKDTQYFFDVEEFEHIINYYTEKNLPKKALHAVGFGLNVHPTSTLLRLRNAQLLGAIGKLHRALEELTELELLEPGNDEIFLTKASILSQQRKHTDAIRYYEKAIACCDEEFLDDIYIDLAFEYENFNKYDEAIATLHKALDINPENETIVYELAYCYEITNRIEESIRFYTSFIDQNPYSFIAWYNLGNAFCKNDEFDKGIEAYDYCLVINEEFASAYFNKANALMQQEKYEEALTVFKESTEYEEPQAATCCFMGECYLKMDDLSTAFVHYKKSLEISPQFTEAWFGLGLVLMEQGNTLEAFSCIENAIEEDAENTYFLGYYADALAEQELFDKAIATYNLVLELDQDDKEIWIKLADATAKHVSLFDSLAVLAEAFEIFPNDVELVYRKAAYLHRLKAKNEALEALNDALTLDKKKYQVFLEYFEEDEITDDFRNLIEIHLDDD